MEPFTNFNDIFDVNNVEFEEVAVPAGGDDTNSNSSATRSPPEHQQRQKRRRIPVNCQYCRVRKMRCDRNQPCSNCIKKNGGKCEYSRGDEPQSSRKSASRTISKTNLTSVKTADSVADFETTNNGLVLPNISRAVYQDDAAAKTNKMTNVRGPADDRSVGAFLSSEQFARDRKTSQLNSLMGKSGNVQDRLDKMEQLILTMLSNQEGESNSSSPNDSKSPTVIKSSPDERGEQSTVDDLRESLGMLKLDQKGKSIYHGDTHWVYLFHEMNQVQDFFKSLRLIEGDVEGGMCNVMEGINVQGTNVMRTSGFTYSGREILASIPDQETCQILIERYFEVFAPSIDIVNRGWFDQSFHDFWMAPAEAEILWVALLLCMLLLALKSYSPGSTPEQFQGLFEEKQSIWSQGVEMCSAIGKITFKPGLINMRILVLWIFAQAEGADWHDKGWCTMSLVIRVAQSMGLHRDPQHFVLSPFDAEERRRIWSIVRYLDAYCSVGQGLPMGISSEEEDVAEPANIEAKDMMAAFGHFPVARDLNSPPTSSSYMIFQNRLLRLRARAFSINLGIKQSYLSYKELWVLDAEIRKFYNDLPKYMRQKCTHESQKSTMYGSSVNMIDLQFQRFMMENDFLKTLVVLHRVYSQRASSNSAFNASRKVTVECSLRIIELHKWLLTTTGGDQVLERFCFPISAFTVPYFMHAGVVITMRLLNDPTLAEAEKDQLVSVADDCEEILSLVLSKAQFNPIHIKLTSSMFKHTRQLVRLSPMEREQQANVSASGVPEQDRGMKVLPIGTSKTYEIFGAYGGPKPVQEKAFILGLDSSDAEVSVETLFSPNKPGSLSSGRTVGATTIDDNSPDSIHTVGGSQTENHRDDDMVKLREAGSEEQTYAVPIDDDFSLFQAKTPGGTSNLVVDNFFEQDVLRMQEVVGSEVWDSFLKNIDNNSGQL